MNEISVYERQTQTQGGLSVIGAMANGYGMRAEAFEQTLRKTVVPTNCNREEFAAFILVAKQYNLNPITREIYALPKKGGGIQPVVGVDGWYRIMNEHPQCDGIEFDDHFDQDGKISAITCRIYRKDRSRAVAVRELLSECTQGTEPWRKWPYRMLRHKAAIQAARVAFGFSGIIDPDEAERFIPAAREDYVQQRPAVRQLQVAADRIIDDEIPASGGGDRVEPASAAPKAARKRKTADERLAEANAGREGNGRPAPNAGHTQAAAPSSSTQAHAGLSASPATPAKSSSPKGRIEIISQEGITVETQELLPADEARDLAYEAEQRENPEPEFGRETADQDEPEIEAFRDGWRSRSASKTRVPPRTITSQDVAQAWIAGYDAFQKTVDIGNAPTSVENSEAMLSRMIDKQFA